MEGASGTLSSHCGRIIATQSLTSATVVKKVCHEVAAVKSIELADNDVQLVWKVAHNAE